MKKENYIITALLLLAAPCAFSQVAIGKASISSTSVSLEFGAGNKGMVLPWVNGTTGVTNAVPGTFVYDLSDHKVKYNNGTADWTDLSVNTEGTADSSIQDSKTEAAAAKVIIGSDADTNTTPGILVLSDTDKAMILPKVASPHLNIIAPAPGMMVYDTTNHLLVVYNGTNWTFWKPATP